MARTKSAVDDSPGRGRLFAPYEVGALIRRRHFAAQLRSQLEHLISTRSVSRLQAF